MSILGPKSTTAKFVKVGYNVRGNTCFPIKVLQTQGAGASGKAAKRPFRECWHNSQTGRTNMVGGIMDSPYNGACNYRLKDVVFT